MRVSLRRSLTAGFTAVLLMIPSKGLAQVSVVFTWHQLEMQSFYLADFFQLAQQSGDDSYHPDYFTINLINTSGIPQNVAVRISLRVESLDIDELAWLETNVFMLGIDGMVINNRDLTRSGQPYYVENSGYEESTAEDLADTILKTGLLPSDTYTFRIQVLNEFLEPIAGALATYPLIVSNPSRVDLIGPGAEFGGPMPVVATATPQFFWSTDAAPLTFTTRFLIRIVKMEAAVDAEEAMQGYAVWEQWIENRTNEIYPSSVNAIPLEPGATYAWQVKRMIQTSSGIRELESPIFWFRIDNLSGGRIGSNVGEEVENMLKQILELQGLLSELEGYEATGQVLVNDKPMELNALKSLFEQMLSGQIQIITIVIK